jgi:hypothetical protein
MCANEKFDLVSNELISLKTDFTNELKAITAELKSFCTNVTNELLHKDKNVAQKTVTYCDVLKTNNNTQHYKHNSTNVNETSGCSTLLVKGVEIDDRCKNRNSILEHLRGWFPRLRIINAHLSARAFIIIKVHSDEDKNRIIKDWKKSFFGKNTQIVPFIAQANTQCSVVAKNIPIDLTEAEILNSVKQTFKGVEKVERFKRGGHLMTTIKLDFCKVEDVNTVINDGLFLGDIYVLPEKYSPLKQPLRCFNCCRFGHTAKICKQKATCSKCSGLNHQHNNCQKDALKCVNCGGQHASFDKNCPKYIEVFKRINFLE